MIITVTNQKGGVGKTTTTLNVAVQLARLGRKTLVVDIDPQSNLSSGLGVIHQYENVKNGKSFPTLYEVMSSDDVIANAIQESKTIKNLYILPSSIELSAADIELVNTISRETILKRILAPIKDDYDVILIDSAPSLGLMTLNGLVAADKLLIPVQAEYFALEGLGQLVKTVNLVKNSLNPLLEIGGVVLTMFDVRTNLSKDVASEIKNFFESQLFDTFIPRNIKLSEAPSHGLSIFEYAPESSGAEAYKRLTDELIARFRI